MNGKPFFLLMIVLFFSVTFPGLGAGEVPKTDLTVKKISFTRVEGGRESITFLCNQPCVPELFSIEGEDPRVVMDMKGVLLNQAKARNFNTGGRFIKRVRSYLDKQTKTLRVVLDMEPSKYYMVRPMQDQPVNTYMLSIYEAISFSEPKPGGSNDAKGSPLSQEKRITTFHPDLRPGEEGKLQEAMPGLEKRGAVKAAREVQSLDQGRSQLNAGEFAAAVDTFTRILETRPQDSLSYRLRGNAYDNLNDRQKAVEDWTQAARLGDTILQSYLDFLQVKWRGNPAP